jgi:CRP-like cAMP-binding protein
MKINTRDNSCEESEFYGVGIEHLSLEEKAILDANKKSIRYSAGEVIIKQNAFLDHIFYLKKGLLKVVVETENQRKIILEIISKNQFIGLSAIFMADFSPISVVALSECHVCQIRKITLNELLSRNKLFSETVLREGGKEFRSLYGKITSLGLRNSHGRLSEVLLYLASEQFSHVDIYSFLSRKELAELAVISTESMNKILKELKNDLIIEIDDKKISLVRPDLLERISRVG